MIDIEREHKDNLIIYENAIHVRCGDDIEKAKTAPDYEQGVALGYIGDYGWYGIFYKDDVESKLMRHRMEMQSYDKVPRIYRV